MTNQSQPVDLTIIVPARNEERRIQACLGRLALFLPRERFTSEVIVSADSCTDQTAAMVEEVVGHASFPLRLLYAPIRLGKGGAIREGVKAGRGKYVAFLDVDVPVDLKFIGLALQHAGTSDVVNGSRFLKDSARTDPWFRRFLSWGYHAACRILLGVPYDTQCGFKVCEREAAEEIFDYVVTDGFSFDTEFMAQARKHGYTIHEIPVDWLFDRNTSLKTSFLAWRMLSDLLSIKLRATKTVIGNRRDLAAAMAFYNSVAGDVRWRATHSLFLPRRWWYRIKDGRIHNTISGEGAAGRILDVGCGSGVLLKRLSGNGDHDIHGVDISIPAVEFTNRLIGRGVAQVAEATNLPFRDGAFHIVVASEVIEYLSDFEAGLKELHRVLSKSGRLLITTPRPGTRWHLLEAIWIQLRREPLEFDHSLISPGRLRWGLIKTGFNIRRFESFLFGCEQFIEAVKE